jgi:hypothetical protein
MKALVSIGVTEREQTTAINELIKGRINTTGTVTLASGAAVTTTEVKFPLVSKGSVILLQAVSQSAAGMAMWVTVGEGVFTIHHPASVLTDRQLGWVALGGEKIIPEDRQSPSNDGPW